MKDKEKASQLLAHAGIAINGSNPWDMQVHDERLYQRVFQGGTLALGEAYMDGWWDALCLDQLVDRALSADLEEKIGVSGLTFHAARALLFNLQSSRRAFQIGETHYDIGNDLYKAMLDRRMVYSCGYWSGIPPAGTLEEAQEAKLDLVCRKIGLERGDRLLDIGGGWGSLAKFAAKRYGAKVVAITVSKEQLKLGKQLVRGLPVEIRLQDYREVDDGPYDHVVSLGMFEHVGYKNYRTFLTRVRQLLSRDGLFLLHTIGKTFSRRAGDPWIHKYIFPNGLLPSAAQITKAAEKLFGMEDWHSFGADYDRTLMEWFANFERHWPELKHNYDERFYRMWKYYLLTCAGNFRSRKKAQLWQIVFSKRGVRGGYQSVR